MVIKMHDIGSTLPKKKKKKKKKESQENDKRREKQAYESKYLIISLHLHYCLF
jgi:hypothetical protein